MTIVVCLGLNRSLFNCLPVFYSLKARISLPFSIFRKPLIVFEVVRTRINVDIGSVSFYWVVLRRIDTLVGLFLCWHRLVTDAVNDSHHRSLYDEHAVLARFFSLAATTAEWTCSGMTHRFWLWSAALTYFIISPQCSSIVQSRLSSSPISQINYKPRKFRLSWAYLWTINASNPKPFADCPYRPIIFLGIGPVIWKTYVYWVSISR